MHKKAKMNKIPSKKSPKTTEKTEKNHEIPNNFPKIPARLNISENFSNNKTKHQSLVDKKRVENHEKFNKEINQANYVLEQLLETCNKMLSTSQVQENSPVKIEEALRMIRENNEKNEVLEGKNEVFEEKNEVFQEKNEVFSNKLEEIIEKNEKITSNKDFDDYPADFEVFLMKLFNFY